MLKLRSHGGHLEFPISNITSLTGPPNDNSKSQFKVVSNKKITPIEKREIFPSAPKTKILYMTRDNSNKFVPREITPIKKGR